MSVKGFEGWYFKHQCGDYTIAFIPGRSESGAFIQVIDGSGSRLINLPILIVKNDVIYTGKCVFSSKGVFIDLPGIKGEIKYGPLTPLRYDIMGPFRFLPMQCRHGVISMNHALQGTLVVDGERRVFDGGAGYIEKDSGRSFPRSYLWLQCNSFSLPCSVMISVADIPFAVLSFRGCICAVIYKGKEYRLATYKGVKIKSFRPDYICLTQGKLKLEIEIDSPDKSFSLFSPVNGKMTGIIKESSNTEIRVCLISRGSKVFDLKSPHASYEFCVPAEASDNVKNK